MDSPAFLGAGAAGTAPTSTNWRLAIAYRRLIARAHRVEAAR
jgi:hypothetical protein